MRGLRPTAEGRGLSARLRASSPLGRRALHAVANEIVKPSGSATAKARPPQGSSFGSSRRVPPAARIRSASASTSCDVPQYMRKPWPFTRSRPFFQSSWPEPEGHAARDHLDAVERAVLLPALLQREAQHVAVEGQALLDVVHGEARARRAQPQALRLLPRAQRPGLDGRPRRRRLRSPPSASAPLLQPSCRLGAAFFTPVGLRGALGALFGAPAGRLGRPLRGLPGFLLRLLGRLLVLLALLLSRHGGHPVSGHAGRSGRTLLRRRRRCSPRGRSLEGSAHRAQGRARR